MIARQLLGSACLNRAIAIAVAASINSCRLYHNWIVIAVLPRTHKDKLTAVLLYSAIRYGYRSLPFFFFLLILITLIDLIVILIVFCLLLV